MAAQRTAVRAISRDIDGVSESMCSYASVVFQEKNDVTPRNRRGGSVFNQESDNGNDDDYESDDDGDDEDESDDDGEPLKVGDPPPLSLLQGQYLYCARIVNIRTGSVSGILHTDKDEADTHMKHLCATHGSGSYIKYNAENYGCAFRYISDDPTFDNEEG